MITRVDESRPAFGVTKLVDIGTWEVDAIVRVPGSERTHAGAGTMSDIWAAAGTRWDDRMAEVVGTLREHNPKLRTQIGHDTSNEFFALRAWASLSRDGTPNEDLAVSLDFTRVPRGVEYRADIAYGDGQIIAETPQETIETSDDPAALRTSVWKALDAVDAFLDANHGVLVTELARSR